MINTEKFVSSLLPQFEKSRIDKHNAAVAKEYAEIIIPSYEHTAKALKAAKGAMELRNAKLLEPEVLKRINRAGGIVPMLAKELPAVQGKLELCTKLIEEHFQSSVTREGLNYARINVIRFLQALDFAAKVARRLILHLFAVSGSNELLAEDVGTKAFQRDEKWLYSVLPAFFKILDIINMRDKDIESKFKNIPAINLIEGEVETVEQTFGQDKVEPLQLGFIRFRYNPIYHIRIAYENYMHDRYMQAKSDYDAIQLAIIALRDGEQSPQNKKLMETYLDKSDELRRKMRDYTDSAEGEANVPIQAD